MAELKLPVAIGPLAIFKTGPAEFTIKWVDGHQAIFPFRYLRDLCPCATCGTKSKEPPKPTVPGRLPMMPMMPVLVQGANGPADVVDLAPIGRYAITFAFGDGHSSGIYSFEYLRQICPCEKCAAGRQQG